MTDPRIADKIDLNGQVALVTGGSRGLGQAYAQGLAAAGAAVAVTARSEEQLNETVKMIEEAGGRAIAIPADVTDQQAVERAVATVAQQLGPVDLLANSAGVPGPWTSTWEADPDEWWSTLNVNVRGRTCLRGRCCGA